MSSPKNAQDTTTAAPPGVASEAPKRDRPKWYYRLVILTIKKDRDVEDRDFDEDLSELEESDDAGDKSDCEGPVCNCEDADCECDCESLASSLEDNLSERSYTESDADWYYELKERREERKRDLLEYKKRMEREKEGNRVYEISRMKEVQEAYDCFTPVKIDQLIPEGPLKYHHFKLYSTDFLDHRYDVYLRSTCYVEFYREDDEGQSAEEVAKVDGHVYMGVDSDHHFLPFTFPTVSSKDEVRLKSYDGKHEFVLRFISNDHVTLTASKEAVLGDMQPDESAKSEPERYFFSGIRRNFETDVKEAIE
ncbi:hypothetical protein HOO65_060227 [Ceratocystis lukuohia]|uniref:Uncharacterized protein n=1 Tax=Ceratocystis lukuohia TaxID=2019550 RepID=A0ABR4MDR2_9PEZI